MAHVRHYEKGEHPAGFIGWRVTTGNRELGTQRQGYFSDKQYGPEVAKEMAWAYAAEVDQERQERTAYDRLVTHRYRKFEGGEILQVRFFSFGCRGKYPTLSYRFKKSNKAQRSAEARINSEERFLAGWERLCQLKVKQEVTTHKEAWLNYYRDLRPDYDEVVAYFDLNYNDNQWI